MFRGILSTIYLELSGNNSTKKIYEALKKFHKNNFFIKMAKYNTPIGTGDVMNTNFCKISVCKDRKKNRVIIISALDNLIKGGSGQAVQNMNFKIESRQAYFGREHRWMEAPVIAREALSTAHPGPCIIEEYDATCLVPPGGTASLDDYGNIVIELSE